MLESVANSEEHKYEVISTEDLLHHVWLHNKWIEDRKERLEALRKMKWSCWKEKPWRMKCKCCENTKNINKINKPETKPSVEEILEEVIEEAAEILFEKEERRGCQECSRQIEKEMEKECKDCGQGVIENELAMVGMDAVCLFPSLSSRRTARIVSERVRRSKMKMKGFNWKKGILYIMMNQKMVTKISTRIRKYFPTRKSNQGVKPGMSSRGLKSQEGSEEKQWYFYRKNPTEEEEKEMISYVVEIAIVILWEN